MVQSLKAKKVAIIDDRTAYGQGLADEVEKAVKAAGGQIVRREYTTDKANDFTAILTNIKGSAPDAIFYGGLDAQSGPMKRQLATLGLKAPLVSGEMTRSDTFIAGWRRRRRHLRLAGRRAAGQDGRGQGLRAALSGPLQEGARRLRALRLRRRVEYDHRHRTGRFGQAREVPAGAGR